MEAVQRGYYSRQYNKGRAEVYYRIPKNSYLKMNATIDWEPKTHRALNVWRQFLVDPKYAQEYALLRDLLDAWGKENQVEIYWMVTLQGSTREWSPFPSNEMHRDPNPHDFPVFTLTIKAVSYFAVNPNYPMDYMSEQDIRDKLQKEADEKQQKENERIRKLKIKCEKLKKRIIFFGIARAIFAAEILLTTCNGKLLSCVFTKAVPLCTLCLIVFGLVTLWHYCDYRQTKDELETLSKTQVD